MSDRPRIFIPAQGAHGARGVEEGAAIIFLHYARRSTPLVLMPRRPASVPLNILTCFFRGPINLISGYFGRHSGEVGLHLSAVLGPAAALRCAITPWLARYPISTNVFITGPVVFGCRALPSIYAVGPLCCRGSCQCATEWRLGRRSGGDAFLILGVRYITRTPFEHCAPFWQFALESLSHRFSFPSTINVIFINLAATQMSGTYDTQSTSLDGSE